MKKSRLTVASEAAQFAGEMLLDHFQHGDRTGSLKGDRTLITEADNLADRMIQELIKEYFPEDKILSEEGDTVYPNSTHVWVIDPLDGTVNFSQGLGYWGVSIAHLEEGFPQTSALYFPVTNELFIAQKGKGAQLNGQELQVSSDFNEDLFPLFLHCSRMGDKYQSRLPYKKRSLGSAAYQLCLVATNTAILSFESTPRIWDFAGSWLIVKEAGGLIESFNDSQPFPAQPGKDYQKIPFSIGAAVSQDVMLDAKKNIIRR
jgi:myo-inositol-1(or 4)-monophosphatase